ncbi:MAG: UPF0182 family protein, partial [Coriobacteriales bacterium]|nr:UPF0182 family protein [Coriobacteriales bacterium]
MNPRQRNVIIAAIIVTFLFVGLPIISWFVRVYVDWLWFGDLGQRAVFWTQIVSRLSVFAVFFVVALAVLLVNMFVARRLAPRAVPISMGGSVPEQVEEIIRQLRTRFTPWLDRLVIVSALALAFLMATGMATQWETFRLALSGAQFPYDDPQFGMNVGFFVFQLPALRALVSWLTSLLVLTTIAVVIVHVLDGAIQPWARLRGFAPHVKAHLSVLLAFIVLTWGFNYWLDIYELDFSPRGQVLGASYTDVHAQIPAYWILIGLSLLTAVVLMYNIRVQGWRLPLVALGVWVAASIVVGGIYPSIVQQFIVAPNEVRLEEPYIERNIDFTRRGFGLADVKGRQFPVRENLTAKDILQSRRTLDNVRLWDPGVIAECYRQLQALRPYYDFPDVDVDRYEVDGVRRQVLVAAREMDADKLPSQAQTWVNRHLVYTHGFGLVMSPASRADTRGLPAFIIGDVPPRTATDLKTEQGRIYFGEISDEYVIVDTGIKEFDFPLGERNAEYEYKGDHGIPIGGPLGRLTWAWYFGSSDILLSAYVEPRSRVLMRRDLDTRLETLAPWLRYEDDAYPVLVDGRIKWIVDAYTESDHFPYSERLGDGSRTNYLRNSVKVVVDAFDGTTTFYAFDESDPVLAAWRSIFPTLVVDNDQIPDEIREHFRYPQGMFEAQSRMYENYHMTNVRVFYNKEDSWSIPGECQGKPMLPFFVLMQLPGDPAEDFLIMQPFTPRNRDNMIGWMAAKSDPKRYGERVVYLFPKERVVLGP